MAEAAAPERQLKRALSAFDLTCIGIGAIIGTGIFALAGTAAAGEHAHAVGSIWKTPVLNFVQSWTTHALHAALQFKRGVREITSEDFARNLELQAQVDTYLVLLLFVAFFRKTQRVSATDRRWLRFHLFARQCPEAFRDANLRGRYLETSKLAANYTRFLDTLNAVRRLDEIRRFHSLDYSGKKTRILALMDGSPD